MAKKKRLNNNQKIKVQKVWLWIFGILLILLCSVILFLTYVVFKITWLQTAQFSLNTTSLNSSEKTQVENIIKEVNPIYLKGQGEIIFVRNITFYYSDSKEDINNGIHTVGTNSFFKHKIYIEYKNSDDYLKTIICHELMHNYMRFDEDTHEIVYDLGNKKVCFKQEIST